MDFSSRRFTCMAYKHTQRSPLCILLYALAVLFMLLGWLLRGEQPFPWLFPGMGVLMLILAASFHHLTVEDAGDRLSVSFGPLPLFRRSIRYRDLATVERGRTTLLDGWGIHLSIRGGWVWNIWGRDCVVLRFQRGTFKLGTDDAEALLALLQSRIER